MGAALIAALLCLPAVAQAVPPTFAGKPTFSGDLVVGATLQATTNAAPDPPSAPSYEWLRCATATTDPAACDSVGGNSPTYVLADGDRGAFMRVRVTLLNADGSVMDASDPRGPVAAKASPPATQPPPSPPTPAPTLPTTTPVFTSVASTVLPASPALLKPFPIVRIRGFFAKRGARITLLSVKGPKSARIHARCIGRGCPVRTLTMFPADGRLHRFERFLRAGIKLQIRVTRPGRIGSYTSFLIRSRKAPLRTDRCLSSKTSKPIVCSTP